MARHSIPKVVDDHLHSSEKANQSPSTIQVGSEGWYAWLKQPTTRSFAFHSQEGTLTARREQRQGTWYWYAYRTQDGRLHKVYLGKSEDLSAMRLHEAVVLLATEHAIPAQVSDMLSPARPQEITLAPPPSPSSVVSMSSLPLLTTKLYVPPTCLNLVARPRLTERMNAALTSKLTLVVAPAGWGKTTLLSSWYAEFSQHTRSLAWVSLDTSDNDPLRFWMYVITALNRLHPGVGENPLTLLQATPSASMESVLTSLLNALILLSTETILVLDDYHLIEAQPIHDALIYLVEHLPPNMHLILASRLDPPLPLARLRVRATLTELRAANLRFTAEETTTFLTEAMGLKLSAEQVAALLTRTEGWIAGLHLAALSLQDRHDVADFITAFTGSHRYVVDYLIEEVLLRQPEDVQNFLVQTCLLDRLSGLLCDAVRERDDSQTLLEQVEHSNLFLVSLDDERCWYRYHHLFAEVLRTRLLQTQPTLVPKLHSRASSWYEQHKLFEEAVIHALAVPDPERAVHLIEQYARFTNFPSRFQLLLGWLNRLPNALVCSHPSLCIMHAIMLMLTHQLDAALARIQDAETCLEKEMPPEQRRVILSLIAAFRANLARLFGDSERCVPLAQQALELMPEPEPEELSIIRMFRPSTLVTAANTYLVNGDMTASTERFVAETVASVRALGNVPTTMRSISNLARLQLLQGKLHQAATTIEQVRQLASRHGGLQDLLNGADYYFILGDLLREWNQLDKAEQYLVQGIDLVRSALTADAEMIMRGYLALARLQQARGLSTQALETLDTFMQVAHQSGFAPLLLAHGAAVRAQVELAQGNVSTALHWVNTSGIVPNDDSLSFLHERECLTLARTYIAQGRPEVKSPFLYEALDLLDRLLGDAEPKARMSSTLEILVLQALALDAQGHQTEAIHRLARAITLAEPEGYIRLFLDEGAPMMALLHQVAMHKIAPGYVTALLKAAGEQVNVEYQLPSSGPLVEPLTEREREVLQLLTNGASNREIADQLVLSVNTVKKHVLNICGKLGAQSRTQAIAKARNLNLC